MERKYDQILGITINSTSRAKVLAFVRFSLAKKTKFSIFTPNPEIVLASTKDKELARILGRASLALPDGIGLSMANRFLSLSSPKNMLLRVPVCFFQGIGVGLATFINRDWLYKGLRPIKGREMFLDLIKLSNKKGWKVFFLGGRKGIGEKAAVALKKNYKKVKIEYFQGPELDSDGSPMREIDRNLEKEAIEEINEFRPQILFIAFGAPKQEKWIDKWISRLHIGGAMVVGGTFDYVFGLPPKWMSESGLEWVWRLVREPKRIGRIINAAIVFPLRVFLYKLNLK